MPAGRNSNRRQGLSRYVYVVSLLSLTLRDSIGTQPGGVTCFIKIACSKGENGLRSLLFGSPELKAIELKKCDPSGKADPLVAINKRVVANDTNRINRGQFDDVRRTV